MKVNVFLILILLVCLSGGVYGQESTSMFAHYINVGQANATLLEFPCGAVLIDAGDQDAKTKQHLKDYLTAFFARRTDLNNTLDLVIITHDHGDCG